MTIFDSAIVGEDVQIGPFARLRPGARLDNEVHIGNFVEVIGFRGSANMTIFDFNKVTNMHFIVKSRSWTKSCKWSNLNIFTNNCTVKNSHIGTASKANHFSYLGDAEIGSDTNIGAGTITCNYDGVNKHKTIIGNNAFIGTNNSLVAPLHIGHGATTGAGSVITHDVADNSLAFERAKQVSKENYQRPQKVNK